MFTPTSLLELAIVNRAIYDSSTNIPRSREDMEAYHLAQQAETCALWLERFGDGQPVEQIGPFGAKKIKTGDIVKIKKGAAIRTYHPQYKDGKIAGRDYKVKVSSVDNGWAPEPNHYHDHELRYKVRHQMVHWAGESGYWHWTASSNVEVL